MKAKTKFQVIKQNIIICSLDGVYNDDEAIELYREFRQHILQQVNRFFIVMDLTLFQGSTPKGFEEAEKFNQWLLETKLVAKVSVKAASVIDHIVDSKIPTRQNFNPEEFSSIEEAVNHISDKYSN